MSLKIKYTALLLAALLPFSACTKKPEQPISPSLKIGIETRETEKVYIVDFSCALKNDNDSTAFTNVTGTINIKNNSGAVLLQIPFTIDTILPFDSGVVLQRIELKEKEAVPLMAFFEMSPDKLESGEDAGARPIESENIEINGLKLVKIDIIDLLKGK